MVPDDQWELRKLVVKFGSLGKNEISLIRVPHFSGHVFLW